MNYSTVVCLVMATAGLRKNSERTPSDTPLDDVLEPALGQLRQRIEDFGNKPVKPQDAFELERQTQTLLRELGRVAVEWAYNHVETAAGSVWQRRTWVTCPRRSKGK